MTTTEILISPADCVYEHSEHKAYCSCVRVYSSTDHNTDIEIDDPDFDNIASPPSRKWFKTGPNEFCSDDLYDNDEVEDDLISRGMAVYVPPAKVRTPPSAQRHPHLKINTIGLSEVTDGMNVLSEEFSGSEEELLTKDIDVEDFFGVKLPGETIRKHIHKVFDKHKEDSFQHFNAWGFYDEIMDIIKRTPYVDDINASHPLTALRCMVTSSIQEYFMQMEDPTSEQEDSVLKARDTMSELFALQEKYLNQNPGFYLDPMCYMAGKHSWPVVSVNAEGFHMCIGVISQLEDRYMAIPFIKEVPHTSPARAMSEATEGRYDGLITNFPAEFWNTINQNHENDGINEKPVFAAIIKYLGASRVGEIIQHSLAGNLEIPQFNDERFREQLAKSLFITEEMNTDNMKYGEMYKHLEFRTLNMDWQETQELITKTENNDKLKVKTYNDIGLAMTDLININQIGFKKTQTNETKEFLSDFLNL